MHWVLFYKRLITLGGAEVLLGQHYAHLKARGHKVTVICFEIADMDRIAIDPADLVVLPGAGTLAQTLALARALRARRDATLICHSGYIELGVAARMAGVRYAIFVHQPTTMSFNEYDKFATRFWPRYCAFARRDAMFERLNAQRAALTPLRRAYIEARSRLSQWVLRGARALFVLSDYAVREKAEIFGLDATFLAGAITPDRVAALEGKPALRAASDPVELVSVSRIDENKRIEILIDAVAELRGRGCQVRLQLGGKGPAMDHLQAHAAHRGVAGAVNFLGFVPEADSVLKSDIEIAPVHHRLPDRIRSHAMICFLALVLYRVMRMRLKAKGHSAAHAPHSICSNAFNSTSPASALPPRQPSPDSNRNNWISSTL